LETPDHACGEREGDRQEDKRQNLNERAEVSVPKHQERRCGGCADGGDQKSNPSCGL
jgi:hypothetical protein